MSGGIKRHIDRYSSSGYYYRFVYRRVFNRHSYFCSHQVQVQDRVNKKKKRNSRSRSPSGAWREKKRGEKRAVFNADKRKKEKREKERERGRDVASLRFSFSGDRVRRNVFQRPHRRVALCDEFHRHRLDFCITRLFPSFREFGRLNACGQNSR